VIFGWDSDSSAAGPPLVKAGTRGEFGPEGDRRTPYVLALGLRHFLSRRTEGEKSKWLALNSSEKTPRSSVTEVEGEKGGAVSREKGGKDMATRTSQEKENG